MVYNFAGPAKRHVLFASVSVLKLLLKEVGSLASVYDFVSSGLEHWRINQDTSCVRADNCGVATRCDLFCLF